MGGAELHTNVELPHGKVGIQAVDLEQTTLINYVAVMFIYYYISEKGNDS